MQLNQKCCIGILSGEMVSKMNVSSYHWCIADFPHDVIAWKRFMNLWLLLAKIHLTPMNTVPVIRKWCFLRHLPENGLYKQSSYRWFETCWCSCDVILMLFPAMTILNSLEWIILFGQHVWELDIMTFYIRSESCLRWRKIMLPPDRSVGQELDCVFQFILIFSTYSFYSTYAVCLACWSGS